MYAIQTFRIVEEIEEEEMQMENKVVDKIRKIFRKASTEKFDWELSNGTENVYRIIYANKDAGELNCERMYVKINASIHRNSLRDSYDVKLAGTRIIEFNYIVEGLMGAGFKVYIHLH